jgi:hypothetical protein
MDNPKTQATLDKRLKNKKELKKKEKRKQKKVLMSL